MRPASAVVAIASVLSFVSAATLVLWAQIVPLKLVSTPWTPFTNAPGSPHFAADLVDAALGRVGIKTTTTIVAADFTAALLGPNFDGSAAAWKDPVRENVLLYSNAYLENRLILVARKGSDISAKTLAALKGKKVAIVGGYSYGDIESAGPAWVRTKSEEDSLTQLLHSQTDYMLTDEIVVEYLLEIYPDEAKTRLAIGTTPLISRPLHFAIRRSRPDSESIISKFNSQLVNMVSDHTYHKLLHVDWIRADINGDGIMEYIPASDLAGQKPPDHAYTLTTTSAPKPGQASTGPRFYIGGTIYTDWASVPNKYKVDDPQYRTPAVTRPASSSSSGSLPGALRRWI